MLRKLMYRFKIEIFKLLDLLINCGSYFIFIEDATSTSGDEYEHVCGFDLVMFLITDLLN